MCIIGAGPSGLLSLRHLGGVSALVAVWQISHKILLICGSIVLTQCWLIFLILMEKSSGTQLIVITVLLVTVYELFEVWAFKSIRLLISFEMETMFGNIWLIGLTFLFINARNAYLFDDPLFLSRA